MFSLNSLNSVTKKFKKIKNEQCGAGTQDLLCKRQECMIPLNHRHTDNRADPYTEPNSCFSDSSDSLNSLNSMKVPLHLEKTPMSVVGLSSRIRGFSKLPKLALLSFSYWVILILN